MQSDKSQRPTILIVRFSSIGDIVLTTATFELLKKNLPSVRLVLVTKKSFVTLFEEHPFLDEVIGFEGFTKEFWRLVNEVSPSAILDLHNNLRSLRIKIRLWNLPSFSVNKRGLERWLFIKKWRKKPVDSVAFRYLKSTEELLRSPVGVRLGSDINAQKNTPKRITLPEFSNVKHSSEKLDSLKLPGLTLGDFSGAITSIDSKLEIELEGSSLQNLVGKYGVLHISATYNTKRIPFKVWEQLIVNQREPLIITGGKEDVENAQALVQVAHHRVENGLPVINAVGKTNLQETAALIQHARWYLGGDTGFTHVAAAYGIPHIVFWGNTSPDLGFIPWLGDKYSADIQEHMRVDRLKCSPCSKLGYYSCPQGHFSCMKLQNLQELESKLQFFRDRNY